MKIKQVARVVAFCAAAMVGLGANAGFIKTQKTVEPGVWTSDYYGGLDYAEKYNIPAFVFWANAGCLHCEAAEKEMNEEPFRSWMAERKIIMIFTESDAKVKKWIKDHAKEKISLFPYAAVYWPENTKGELVLEGFSAYKGQMAKYGARSKDNNAEQIMTAIDFIIPDWDPSGEKPEPVDPKHVHQWSAWTVVEPATCVSDGVQQRTCAGTDCPNPVETQVIKALGHDWDNWTVVTPADIGVDGKKQRVCKRCGKTDTAVIPAIDPEPEVTPSEIYMKPLTLNALVYADELVGTATLKLGKISRKGQVKVTLKITPFGSSGASASATVTPDKYGAFSGTFKFRSNFGGVMSFSLVYNDGGFEFGAENELYSVELGTVQVGGKLDTEEMMFSAEMDYELPEDYDYVVDPPTGEPVYVKNGTKFSFDKAPSIKYKKFKEDGETWYELVIDEGKDGTRTNYNGLKLTYKYSTGLFTGSFKVYASNEFSIDGGKPKLKTYTVKVSGVVVDGVGIGVLKVGSKVVGTCSLN